jgi:hypothetical protein
MTGQPGGTSRTGQLRQVNLKRKDGLNMTGRTGQHGQDNRDRTVIKEKPRLVIQYRSEGQSNHNTKQKG